MFRLGLVSDRLSSLQRQLSIDFYQGFRETVITEETDKTITVLRLISEELARLKDDLEYCQTINEHILKNLGYDPPKPMDDWIDPKKQ